MDSQTGRFIRPDDLGEAVIDVHSHVGVSVGAYARQEFPYCQSLEGLYYRHVVNQVDFGVVFAFSADLYFDLRTLTRSAKMVPASDPLSAIPYGKENQLLLTEVYEFCPEHSSRYLPFVCVDPERQVGDQIEALRVLQHPFYGIKISGVGCQSRLAALLDKGQPLLDFAAERDLPFLFHVTVHPEEEYSQVSDALEIAERNPHLRFCLAHCLGFSRTFLDRAAAAPNVWVDTAALAIQVLLVRENSPIVAQASDRYDWPYDDHCLVMRELMEQFPHTIIWGSDSPAYSYICRRQQGPGTVTEFRLKATYEDEKAALDALSRAARRQASNTNPIAFLFGDRVHREARTLC